MPDVTSGTSPRLELPYIQPAQAQKHVTHNEAIQMLDALVQLVLIQLDAIDPPASPVAGNIYALGAAATGAWSGQDGQLAVWNSGAWRFFTPLEGWRAWDLDTDQGYVVRQGTWGPQSSDPSMLDSLGIATSADAVNRLAVASDATLLTHAGNGHQLKLNKAATGNTASLLFHTGFDGRAEMGLAGDDAFSVKTRAPGGPWADSLRLDPAAQSVTVATGGGVQSRLTQAGLALNRATGGVTAWRQIYDQGNVRGTVSQSAGQVTGALFESGTNANGTFVKFADGTLICAVTAFVISYLNSSTIRGDWMFPHAFVSIDRSVTFTFQRGVEGPPNPNYRNGVIMDDAGGSFALTHARLVLLSNQTYASNGNMTVNATAIGRWF